MSTEVTTRSAAVNQWDDGFQTLVKQTVLKPKEREATAAELALLAEQAVRTGLDPMSRQIYGIYRKSRGKEVMTLQVGIDGLRTIAERTGAYLGQGGPYWCGKDGQWREIWTETTPPVAAKVTVRKVIAGNIAETPAVAHLAEYMPVYDGKPLGLWGEKPALMLAKCAEALALRKAFPQDMGGLYTDDEMSRADPPPLDPPPPVAPVTEPPALEAVPLIDAERAENLRGLIREAKDAGVIDQPSLRLMFTAAGVDVAEVTPAAVAALTVAQADEIDAALTALLPVVA